MNRITLIIFAALIGLLPACNGEKKQNRTDGEGRMHIPAPAKPEAPVDATTSTGLVIKDLKVGGGPRPFKGKLVKVHYVGMTRDGARFVSSREHGDPLVIRIGSGEVVQGWDEGISGMRVGGKRRLIISPALLLPGKVKLPFDMPAAQTLVFDIDLLDIEIPAELKEKR